MSTSTLNIKPFATDSRLLNYSNIPPFQPTDRLKHPQHFLTPTHRNLNFNTMNTTGMITSTTLSFGRTCPGTLMQSLLKNHPSAVAALKTLQTSFSHRQVTYQCHLPCPDLRIAHNFVTSISALEDLSVLNYEADGSVLWPAVLHHAKSLRRLGIHSPPREHSHVWTSEIIKAVGAGFPVLTHLEMDLPLEEAEGLVSAESNSESPVSEMSAASPMAVELANLRRLESLHVNIPLLDEESSFAGEHTWNAMGSISFPDPNRGTCGRLTKVIMGRFPLDAALRKLEVRFARRCWDDRCQFYTVGYSVRVERGEDGSVTVEDRGDWVEYLVKWPEYGGVLWDLMQEYQQS